MKKNTIIKQLFYSTLCLLLNGSLLMGQVENQRMDLTPNFECASVCDDYSIFKGTFHGDLPMRRDNGVFYDDVDFGISTINEDLNSVAYVSGEAINISLEITSNCTNLPNTVHIRGVEENNTIGFISKEISVNYDLNSSTYKMNYPQTSYEMNYPTHKVNYFDLIIEWQVSIDNTETWLKIGESKNTIYLTWDTPKAETLSDTPSALQNTGYEHLETIFYLGCDFAKNKTQRVELIENVWEKIKEGHIKRKDGANLYYYNNWETPHVSSSALIKNLDGQCHTWAALFLDILKTQGLTDQFHLTEIVSNYSPIDPFGPSQNMAIEDLSSVITDYIEGNYPTAIIVEVFLYSDFYKVDITTETGISLFFDLEGNFLYDVPSENTNLGYEPNFLVKNWSFSANYPTPEIWSSPFSYLNVIDPLSDDGVLNNSYSFLYSNVTDQEGLSGQSTSNPVANFNNHIVAKISNTYYDASYTQGVSFDTESLFSYEEANIEGFYYAFSTELDEVQYNIDFNGNNVIENDSYYANVWFIAKNSSNFSEIEVRQDYNY